jgi:microcystin-dependent protein
MALPFFNWSRTAANNATADSTVNWQEGQSPSSINDSARAMMASTAAFRDDISGAILTTGTSTAYAVSSFQVFDTLAHLNGQMIAFTPHATNGATVTLNVDGLGAKPLRSAPSAELLAGVLIQGTPYIAVYNSSDAAFYLHGFYGNPYNVPLLGGMDYWDDTAPNSSFIFPRGQAISRTTYAAAFAKMGTRFGAGDGTTTFNVPDKSGRVSAMTETVATRLTPTYFGGTSTTIGQSGGLESHTLTTAQLASHTHANTLSDPGHVHQENLVTGGGGASWPAGGTASSATLPGPNTASAVTGITINNAAQGGGGAHNNVQPTIVCNYILRII